MSTTHINEYRHKDGDTQGAIVGSELDKVLAKEENWELVSKGSSAPAAQAASEEGDAPDADGAGEEKSDASVDLDSLDRDGLNKLATDLGIEDAESLPNKGKVREVIEAAQAASEEG
jgi:hypothetical protein